MKNLPRLNIEKAGNGGWVIWDNGGAMYQSTPIAAVSNDADLLAWITEWLASARRNDPAYASATK